MNLELNCFYKCHIPPYKDIVFKCIDVQKELFIDDEGSECVFANGIGLIKSGMNPNNWKVRNQAVRNRMLSTGIVGIPKTLYDKLQYLGFIPDDVRDHNVGSSNYSKHFIQPWSVWLDYPELTSWDHDIIKRVLRSKEGSSREEDYRKIIHICQERIRQLSNGSI